MQGSLASQKSVTPPKLVKSVEPEYPEAAREKRLEPSIVLALGIDEQGHVTHVEVVESAGAGFDEAMVAAAKQFEFVPAHRGDKPVRSKVLYKHQFQAPPAEVAAAPLPPPRLVGRARIAETREPLAGAHVSIFAGPRKVAELSTDGQGGFSTSALEPGTYKVVVEAEGFEPFSAEETLEPGQELEVSYQLVAADDEGTTVVVRGVRPSREVTRRTVSRRELTLSPGTRGDAFRAIENMPGVARSPALSGQLVVRGLGDQATPVFVDGLWLPTIYHFGGLSSVVPTEMLDEINFYPGNFSVRYGRSLAGVVDGHLRETRSDGKYHGLAQLDFIDARGMLEGPIPGVKGWNFIGGFRRSHVDAWLVPLVLKGNDTDLQAAPVYYDYQLIADTHPTAKSYLRIGFLGYDDHFRAVDPSSPSSGTTKAGNASLGVGTIYENTLSAKTSLNITASVARSHQSFIFGNINFDTEALGVLTRGEVSYRMTPRATVRTGYDILLAPYTSTG
ncbi:MAG TPA: TonB family protein, partial [Polyangiaceae bacterium]|nr:TonB family protein [Polyangiaceae bacterium]